MQDILNQHDDLLAPEDDPDISDVMFNPAFLKESAKDLAKIQESSTGDIGLSPVKPKLNKAKETLLDAYRLLAKSAKTEKEVSPATEWLIDNFYIIQEQIVQVENDFPVQYQRSIPNLTRGDHKGMPRVYELVLTLANYSDNIIDADILTRYVQSYQEEEILMLGEVWAIPIMSRFVLIRQLAERSESIVRRKKMQLDVQGLIREILEVEHPEEPGYITHKLSSWIRSKPEYNVDQPLLTELHSQLQSVNMLQDEQKRWFRYRFNQFNISFEEAVRLEAQKESRLQVSIQNAVVSLRKISETDWTEMVEECSFVNQIMKLDPSGVYPHMDFQTRDSYRRTVEKLARNSEHSETEIAELVLIMAEENVGLNGERKRDYLHKPEIIKQHVGYFLAGDGYSDLIKKTEYRMPAKEKIQRLLGRHAGYYLGITSLHTLVLLVILWVITGTVTDSPAASLLMLLIALFPALDLSVAAINRFFAFLLPPRILPKMDYEEGIPEESRTLVVVPTLFTSPDDVKRQIENIEIRALANPDPGLQFAVLSDFTDAPEKEMDSDRDILETAKKRVSELNRKYMANMGDKFYLLHRERLWNERQGVWMGRERKRGKLEELNRLVTDPSSGNSFTVISGDFISSIKKKPVEFVLTLDTDTKLPPDSAQDLVRTAAHPLNRATLDVEKVRITRGYGIIQPRISIPPESARKTWFTRIFSGNVGIDPYSTASSDIYQDLMGEAVYTGKGIYDVRAFQAVLDNRLPENRILSHDLLESTYLRTGLATDIELFDDYPVTYASFSKRNHRWVRGDWQIASWMFGRVPEQSGLTRNPVNLLSRWKIFDNLRRSLNPFFLTLFIVAGWFWLPGAAWIWTLAAFGILAFPIYVTLSTDIVNRPARVRWMLYIDKIRANLSINTVQAVSTLIILPHQAVVNIDAITRTIWRLMISRKMLLEWTTASQVESNAPNSFVSYLKSMSGTVLLGIYIFITAVTLYPETLWITLPFSLMWIAAPLYVWRISRPSRRERQILSDADRMTLGMYARRTWFFFERFVTEENSWLPPDNVQEDPPLLPVATTSPTNIGLALVSMQSAYNMGYITMGELLERVENTLQSLSRLERYKGHFYNWYDIRLGTVLNPIYVSTVDSGNLAAGLIVISEAIKQKMKTKHINKDLWRGLTDTVITVQDIFNEFRDAPGFGRNICNNISKHTGVLLTQLQKESPVHPADCLELLKELKKTAVQLSSINLISLRNKVGDARLDDLLFWIESPLNQIEKFIHEMRILAELNVENPTLYSAEELIRLTDKQNSSLKTLKQWRTKAANINKMCNRLTEEMDFTFLYNNKRRLFYIGYNVEKTQEDSSTYDLLASEARIASYIAIAKGDVSSEHWFRLSRRLTSLDKNEILLSWGGTMFEYLMPLLFMRSYPNTLLSHTYNSIIRWQKNYGGKRGHPWGTSESAYYFLNLEMQYQYRAFGTPGLGMKRGLAEEYVIAPYATMLALMVDIQSSVNNLKQLESAGGLGLFGFYDAIDYTTTRLKEKETHNVVKTYMAHHHGMSLAALDNVLNGWKIHHYFHSDPRIRGCELLLQERIPRGVPIKEPHPIDVEMEPGEKQTLTTVVEHAGINELDRTPPRAHILSNGSYTTFLTHAGSGYSKFRDTALTAWTPDTVQDASGLYLYVRDLNSGNYWSAGHHPVKRKPDRYDTWFHNGKMVTSRVDDWIETTTEICVSPDLPFEFRKVTLTNYADRNRAIDLTSYSEVVLNRLEDHNSHPAFSKLFVQTDYLAQHHAILVKRRPRSADEKTGWLVHTFAGLNPDNLTEPPQFETERVNFIGRGRTLQNPLAMDSGSRLNGSLGNVSDPIISLRNTLNLKPGEKTEFTFGLGWAETREQAIQMADDFENTHATNRVFDLSSVYSRVELTHLDISSRQAHYFQKLASWILYHDRRFRTNPQTLIRNRKTQKNLWAYGISGDLPLIVFRIRDMDDLGSVKTLVKAHTFWRQKGLATELLILNDHPPSYADEVQEAVQREMEFVAGSRGMNTTGGIFIHRSEKIPEEDITLFLSVAHAVFEDNLPNLKKIGVAGETNSWTDSNNAHVYSRISEQVHHGVKGDDTYIQPLEMEKEGGEAVGDMDAEVGRPAGDVESESGGPAGDVDADNDKESETELDLFNGFGGFSEEGDEYRIHINRNPNTGHLEFPPNPWINVIANPSFGFIATESGAGYTWSENSRENKMTSWSNDPVMDPHSEVFYIRDEDNMTYWSPTPGPVPGRGNYMTSHGFGYTRYEHRSSGLDQTLIQFTARDEPVKISLMTIKNREDVPRRLSLFRYQDWVMGVDRSQSGRFVITDASDSREAIYAVNHYNNEFAGRVAFTTIQADEERNVEHAFTTDRCDFIGRNRSLGQPLALEKADTLNNRIAIGGEPCGAMQARFDLDPGEQATFLILTGETNNRAEAGRIIQKFSTETAARKELKEVKTAWKQRLQTVQVTTPDKSLNLMLNGWLMYQNLSCRTWARTAFYQAGGAFGYRDQLQDAMAAFYADPELTRKQILLHASHQFKEGDTLHWWHPPSGRGIRSRISDDRLWLPYTTLFYLKSTGDDSILHETTPWISARLLEPGEQEAYLIPVTLAEVDTVYEHCCRAIEISMDYGVHGLPLIGAGDWNDGMNHVGKEGKGESVWLGFFLYTILERFSEISRNMNDHDRGDKFEQAAAVLKENLNTHGWDGEWYLRAYYDDGTPLGSSDNDECRIDAISQSWSVITGVAPDHRKKKALKALEEHLISEKDGIIRLLYPPFDKTEKDPGYIKGYIPGVRENGGQYTHAAIWAVKAFAEAGLGDKAVRYLSMINPVNHALSRRDAQVYRVEPYVVAADVYGEPPLTGQGGWTWYTGSGGWMYRVALESILGITWNNRDIVVQPVISSAWKTYTVQIRPDKKGTRYNITVENTDSLQHGRLSGDTVGEQITFDGERAIITIKNDGDNHDVTLRLSSGT